jgi:hypothetical protein
MSYTVVIKNNLFIVVRFWSFMFNEKDIELTYKRQ